MVRAGRGNLPEQFQFLALPAQVRRQHTHVHWLTVLVCRKICLARMQVTLVCQRLAHGAQGAFSQRRSSGKDVLVLHAKKRPTAAGISAAHMMHQRAGCAALSTHAVVCLKQRDPARLVHAHHAGCGVAFKASAQLPVATYDPLSRRRTNRRNPLQAEIRVEHPDLLGRNLQLILGKSQRGIDAHLGRTALQAELRSPDCARSVFQAKSNAQLAAAGRQINQAFHLVPWQRFLDSLQLKARRVNLFSLFVELLNACVRVAVGSGPHVCRAYPSPQKKLVALGAARQFAIPGCILIPQPAGHANFACRLLSCLRQRRAFGVRILGPKRGPRGACLCKGRQQVLPAFGPHRLIIKLPLAGFRDQWRLKGISAGAEQVAAITQKLLHSRACRQWKTFAVGQHQQVESSAIQPLRIGQLLCCQENDIVGLS